MKSYEIHQEGIKKTLKDIITEIEEKGDLCYIPPSNKTVLISFFTYIQHGNTIACILKYN